MTDGSVSGNETVSPSPKNFPLPTDTRFDKKLGEDGQKALQDQWNLFNDLRNEIHFPNPVAERQNQGKPVLTKGTLIHGTRYDHDKIKKIKTAGILSGELNGIPEDTETNFCADFFRVPSDMTVADYLKWCQEIQTTEGSLLRKHKPEFNYLPTPGKRSKQIAFIVDTTDPKLKPLLENDAYNPQAQSAMGKIITQLPIPLWSPTAERMSAVLCGTPSNYIDAAILGDGMTPEEVQDFREVMGDFVVLYNTSGEVI